MSQYVCMYALNVTIQLVVGIWKEVFRSLPLSLQVDARMLP
jgi:hypothetical protein